MDYKLIGRYCTPINPTAHYLAVKENYNPFQSRINLHLEPQIKTFSVIIFQWILQLILLFEFTLNHGTIKSMLISMLKSQFNSFLCIFYANQAKYSKKSCGCLFSKTLSNFKIEIKCKFPQELQQTIKSFPVL